jgi:hypothetical protein
MLSVLQVQPVAPNDEVDRMWRNVVVASGAEETQISTFK